MDIALQEKLLSAWILLDSQLKKSRITSGLTYNEAIVMKAVYDNYHKDGIGKTGVQNLIKNTNILKSLMNRTIDSLCAQNFLRKEREGRSVYVYPKIERMDDFLKIHNNSLKIAGQIIEVIGEKDAKKFVEIANKLNGVNFEFNERK